MIVWMAEPWATYRAGCDALWREHYDEIAVDKHMLMKPDEPTYEALERIGQLHVLVGREAGQMVGYVTSVVRPHMHYADTLVAVEDAYYLTQRCRRGMAGVRMIREWLGAMKRRGVYKAFIVTKPFLDMGPLLERLGGAKAETVYAFTFEENR
jgi:hypothetical protein